MFTLLDVCASSLLGRHANLHCIAPMLVDDPQMESNTFICISGRNKKPNETNRTETDRATTRQKERRPNRVEPEQIHFRTEPNRTDELSKSPEPKRIEPMNFRKVQNRNESNRTVGMRRHLSVLRGWAQPPRSPSPSHGVHTAKFSTEMFPTKNHAGTESLGCPLILRKLTPFEQELDHRLGQQANAPSREPKRRSLRA